MTAPSNLRVLLLHFKDVAAPLGARQTLAVGKLAGAGAEFADSIKRTPGGFLVRFRKRLFFVPDTSVLAAEVEDLDAKPEPEPIPEPPPPPPPPRAVVLSVHERAMQAAIEERKAAAAERKRIADEIVAKETRK